MKQTLKVYTLLIQVNTILNYNTNIDKLDLINNLNSIKLLAISEAFEKFPNEAVDVD